VKVFFYGFPEMSNLLDSLRVLKLAPWTIGGRVGVGLSPAFCGVFHRANGRHYSWKNFTLVDFSNEWMQIITK
jgi:hypothetical protein